MKVKVYSATRATEKEFWEKTALGISFQRMSFDQRMMAGIFFENKEGLPKLYNEAIEKADNDDIIVFIHDDVWLDDYFFCQRIIEGVNNFHIIGLTGNTRRSPMQPGWLFKEKRGDEFIWDHGYLSGVVAHGANPSGEVSTFGYAPKACELMDGVLFAAKIENLNGKASNGTKIRFDERFDFHFYDMDFCRTARHHGLTLGTWPIAVTHVSGGQFGPEAWEANYQKYLEKWKE